MRRIYISSFTVESDTIVWSKIKEECFILVKCGFIERTLLTIFLPLHTPFRLSIFSRQIWFYRKVSTATVAIMGPSSSFTVLEKNHRTCFLISRFCKKQKLLARSVIALPRLD